MKRLVMLVLTTVLAIGLVLPAVSASAHTESDPFATDLIAGKSMDVGDVLVWNDDENIYVKFVLDQEAVDDGWEITETHLYIGANQPPTSSPGQFPYHDADASGVPDTEVLYMMPLADIYSYSMQANRSGRPTGVMIPNGNPGVESGDDVFIAAHAVITVDDEFGDPLRDETGWGNGENFGTNWGMYFMYTVQEGSVIPTPGEDIVVFNDINPFDNGGMGNANNHLLVTNLVDFATSKPRGLGTVVWFDRGRGSKCGGTGECNDSSLATMRWVIEAAGYSITNISSISGSIMSIPFYVKVVFLWNPLVFYTTEEINVFKQFAEEGGRIVFIGEWDAYYGAGIDVENQFLLDMGAVMTNIGMAVDCGYYHDLPATCLRPHQITAGMDGVRIACASVIVPGPQDYPLFYDSTNTYVLAGVAKVDTTPLEVTMQVSLHGLEGSDNGDEGLYSATGCCCQS